ncbi:tRNA (adenosine(37)-N6)-threonylcarbamoyltransferase complex dimerization subunit type 1 TsaB [Fusibacter paucivorans]|uniref:tRNA (Adenosine(37)-N6)-threonylcarbamoyltransferase complex dimerization subunit type 1 TsaB n=1 Tax=Fusibacter paucivorans TaxID=76009 RepID=A0ABS5PN31_9FIRM|nr:tRNA (adenosine(37)-N6)-threonylcarbamoyltransferase complex dimerization subunit type 1 TsaB [Fusibacter paucivorans]MBS7525771.1 tRNA (adenosine(37)-N6)-threonylcarbamoyltransferase complex dimerization subunit type 1 TsaB [Fusibacter paucivorans]
MKLLGIDTSTQTASVAIFENGNILGEMLLNTPLTHSQKLMPMVESLMAQLSLKIKDLDGYYVTTGPGSFTGVRIGVSTVKAFAQAHQKPIVTMSSTALLALGNLQHEGIIVSLLDAKRENVYGGIYRSDGTELETVYEGIATLAEVHQMLETDFSAERILIVGEATSIYPDFFDTMISMWNKNNYLFGKQRHNIINATSFCHLAFETAEHHTYLDITANYMKKSQAERDLK